LSEKLTSKVYARLATLWRSRDDPDTCTLLRIKKKKKKKKAT
jgi:hypothetical protein